MMLFVLALMLLVTAAVLFAAPALVVGNRVLGMMTATVAAGLALVAIAFSTAIYVNDDQGGIVIRKFGADLPANRVVAAHGEKGPQAEMLGPGWHFGFWPWLYDLQQVPTMTIEQGHVGVVMALDGKPLPGSEVFAPSWPASEDLLDGAKFLGSEQGYRGPQLTVLTPGRYRFNPRLFAITPKPALLVNVGEVAVIKANSGKVYQPPANADAATVINGVALVPKGYQGIWKEPLTPGAYNLHPDAYQVTKVQTTNRVYTYQDKKWAIKVRSKDGFTFPVDVRVSVSVSAEETPHLVALLGTPDLITKNDQEDDHLSVLEAKVILPLVRTIFRNVAETMNALQFVNSRTQVEATASTRMRDELKKYRLASDGVFIANIDLDDTDAGKQLLLTQTDREVAVNQQATFAEKKRAEEARATFIKAQEEAEQQRQLAQATYKVQVAEQGAKAREAEAKGEASYISITAEAKQKAYSSMAGAIGPEGVTTLELMKMVSEGKIQITPHVMMAGGAGGSMDALAGTILGGMLPKVQVQSAAPAATTPATPRK
jgi:regulator of protease activity HflC (stomatin/prohibitin superfamily)